MKPLNPKLKSPLRMIDKELIIVFLLVVITAIIFFFVSNQRAFLNFFYLPVLLGAYFYGRRYATMAALFSLILIGSVAFVYPETFGSAESNDLGRWLDIGTWGGFLLVTGYFMGLLYEKKEEARRDIRRTYHGVVEMLSLLIDSVDQHTHSHSYRVSVLAEKLALQLGCGEEEVENIRIAALLHDLGKIGVSRELLNKIGTLTAADRAHLKTHTVKAARILYPLGGRVTELLPLILGHHEKYDGNGYHSLVGDNIPLGARIIAVADVYDALTSDRPYRKALPPFYAKNEILSNSGTHFDPRVVAAFEGIFPTMDQESLVHPRMSHA
ncbi:MAG: HD domain-containing protein [Deltaproteobacteria bacterium]|nr:HD domain-containing protein [Deltaproteobacteria bacterium]TLN02841.1 MAG: HD domain-containing protein [bacterium]